MIQATYTDINLEELNVITGAIWRRYGIDFRNYETTSLRRRVGRVLDKFALESVYALWKKFLYEDDFITTFINEITVGLTELFRNPDLWEFLGKHYLESLSPSQSLRIWHAGCSTGEEVYSMLITLKEYQRLEQTALFATDLSSEALEVARAGRYDASLWKGYSANYKKFSKKYHSLEHYTTNVDSGFQVKESLKKPVDFEVHNLVRDPAKGTYDWIFCRNVLIYFDATLKMKVLRVFHEALRPGGILILGYFDYLSFPQEFFKLQYPEYKIYVRNDVLPKPECR